MIIRYLFVYSKMLMMADLGSLMKFRHFIYLFSSPVCQTPEFCFIQVTVSPLDPAYVRPTNTPESSCSSYPLILYFLLFFWSCAADFSVKAAVRLSLDLMLELC